MGATYLVETHPGATPQDALEILRAKFRADGYTDQESDGGYDGPTSWPDPFRKGFVQVHDKPVADVALDWMRGWIAQHPPEGIDPEDKWGPWMTFPVESGGWMFFGWVNT